MSQAKKILPRLTIDNVIFAYADKQLSVLLIKHGEGRSKGQWGLPGDWLGINESLEERAAISLFDRTGLKNIKLQQLQTFSAVDRYPGKRIITTAFYTLIKQNVQKIKPSDDELAVNWIPVNKVPKLIFDHKVILKHALKHLRTQVRHVPIGLDLLPKKFTLLELQDLYEALLDRSFDKPNFRRKILKLHYLIDCKESIKAGKHRPAALYSFDRAAYKSLIKKGFSFSL